MTPRFETRNSTIEQVPQVNSAKAGIRRPMATGFAGNTGARDKLRKASCRFQHHSDS
jgi:hypothetical protein